MSISHAEKLLETRERMVYEVIGSNPDGEAACFIVSVDRDKETAFKAALANPPFTITDFGTIYYASQQTTIPSDVRAEVLAEIRNA